MGFPERLAAIRKEKKLGFSELAQIIGIHSTQLRRYEKDESQPTGEVSRKLAVALNVPGDMLFFDEDERKPHEDFLFELEASTQPDLDDKKSI